MTSFRMIMFGVSAAGPMVILIGGITAAYAVSGSPGLPLGYLVVGAVLGLLSVGYLAMARRVRHPAVYYAVAARGLGRPFGVAAGMVGLTAYNAILMCMFPFLGGTLAGMLGGSWWVYALILWAVIALVGPRPVAVSVWVLAVVLVLSAVVGVLFLIATLSTPIGGHVNFDGFSPSSLRGAGLGTALALLVASPMGFDGTPSYGFEAVDKPGTKAGTSTVRATFWSLGILTGFSALAAWAMQVHYGVHEVAAAAGDVSRGVPFDVMVEQYGLMIKPFTWIVLALGVVCTQLSLLAVVARYFYAMATTVCCRRRSRSAAGASGPATRSAAPACNPASAWWSSSARPSSGPTRWPCSSPRWPPSARSAWWPP